VNIEQLQAENERLRNQIENLHSVMVRAAEEIAEHWQAHCDKDGLGPVNLLRRLEEGIPSEYAYKAGDFARLRAELKEYKEVSGHLDSSLVNQAKECAELRAEVERLRGGGEAVFTVKKTGNNISSETNIDEILKMPDGEYKAYFSHPAPAPAVPWGCFDLMSDLASAIYAAVQKGVLNEADIVNTNGNKVELSDLLDRAELILSTTRQPEEK
jgi:hypothetical protein